MAEPEKTRQASSGLERLRERIDLIDHAILERLNDRARVVQGHRRKAGYSLGP